VRGACFVVQCYQFFFKYGSLANYGPLWLTVGRYGQP